MLWAIEAANRVDVSNWSLEVKLVDRGRTNQLVLVSARHITSILCSCWRVIRCGVLSVVDEVLRPMMLLYHIWQVLGSLVEISSPKKVCCLECAKGFCGAFALRAGGVWGWVVGGVENEVVRLVGGL